LDKVVPILENAENALNKIKSKDIDEIKTFKSVGESVIMVMEAIIYTFEEEKQVTWK